MWLGSSSTFSWRTGCSDTRTRARSSSTRSGEASRSTGARSSATLSNQGRKRWKLEHLLGDLHAKEGPNVLDLVHDRGDRGAGEQEPDRDVVKGQDEGAGVAAGRDVGRDDLVEEPSDSTPAVADVDGCVDGGDPAGRVVGRPPRLLDDRADGQDVVDTGGDRAGGDLVVADRVAALDGAHTAGQHERLGERDVLLFFEHRHECAVALDGWPGKLARPRHVAGPHRRGLAELLGDREADLEHVRLYLADLDRDEILLRQLLLSDLVTDKDEHRRLARRLTAAPLDAGGDTNDVRQRFLGVQEVVDRPAVRTLDLGGTGGRELHLLFIGHLSHSFLLPLGFDEADRLDVDLVAIEQRRYPLFGREPGLRHLFGHENLDHRLSGALADPDARHIGEGEQLGLVEGLRLGDRNLFHRPPVCGCWTGRGLFGRSSRPLAQTSTRNEGWGSSPEFLLRGREAPQQRSRAPERAQDTPFVAFGCLLPRQGDP